MIESCDKALSEKELEEQGAAAHKELNRCHMKEYIIITRVDAIRSKSTLGISDWGHRNPTTSDAHQIVCQNIPSMMRKIG
jgi:hypothetical protein